MSVFFFFGPEFRISQYKHCILYYHLHSHKSFEQLLQRISSSPSKNVYKLVLFIAHNVISICIPFQLIHIIFIKLIQTIKIFLLTQKTVTIFDIENIPSQILIHCTSFHSNKSC